MNALTKPAHSGALVTERDAADLRQTLKNSLYPGAADASIDMVVAYCQAAGLDVMLKPVHIVPMWSSKEGCMRDVIMPGIGMYRVQASRSGEWAGVTEPEFGPMIAEKIGGVDIEYPEWCRVTTRRLMRNGAVAEFTAIEYWRENYAVKGGKEKSVAPNAMWMKRPRGQIAKCSQAQSLRLAFPEIGAAPTAEEMEGKVIEADAEQAPAPVVQMPRAKPVPVAAPAPADPIEGEFSETPAPIAPAHSAPAAAPPHAAPAAADGEQGPLSDLSPSQTRLIRAKATNAGYCDDAAILAQFPDLSKATINDALHELSRV